MLELKLAFNATVQRLTSWRPSDPNPCGWEGISCSVPDLRVQSMSVPPRLILLIALPISSFHIILTVHLPLLFFFLSVFSFSFSSVPRLFESDVPPNVCSWLGYRRLLLGFLAPCFCFPLPLMNITTITIMRHARACSSLCRNLPYMQLGGIISPSIGRLDKLQRL